SYVGVRRARHVERAETVARLGDCLSGYAHVPDRNLAGSPAGIISGGRSEPAPVRPERDAQDHIAMPHQPMRCTAGCCIPDPHRMIGAGRGEPSTVRAVSQPVHLPGMPGELEDLVAGRHVPNAQRVVMAEASSKTLTIRAKRHAVDAFRM